MTNEAKTENLVPRPPIVVVMGHVDHGKSSLLEAIREDFVITAKESGGITQHIGAYEIEWQDKEITFIDTPGHEAFSAMRQRGAKVADVAILVVDATEGVRPQTKEAINFIKKAGIPMVVAINKMDKPGADPERVKQELAKEDVLIESWGGKVPSCNISAKTKQGIAELLETILLVAELEDLKADLDGLGEGTVIESSLDPQKGPVATLILAKGVLRQGDIIATASALGKVRCLSDFKGKPRETALPSYPVSILGFEAPPGVGEQFRVFQTREEAQGFLAKEKPECRPVYVLNVKEGVKVLNVILKSDVLGSCEAIENILRNLPQEKVILRSLKSEVGEITVDDVKIAESGKAKIFGFRVKVDENTALFAKQKKVKIEIFDVIYELVQAVRAAMLRILTPETKRVDLGKFKVSHLFKQDKESQIIGGRVTEGEITKNTILEVLREEEIIGKGRLKNLQKEKEDIGKAEKGQEAGILFQGDVKIEIGDILMVYREERERGTL